MKVFALLSLVLSVLPHTAHAQATCSATPECSNLEGDCCPSITSDGLEVDLFCCGQDDQTCLTNPMCAARNLTGACCPSPDGVMLDCCDLGFAQCKAHPDCAHLANDCCPTKSGVFLDCCLDDTSLANVTFPETSELASCAANSACVGLVDDCCPTKDGVFLCKYTHTSRCGICRWPCQLAFACIA
jgi:hypothetical protein